MSIPLPSTSVHRPAPVLPSPGNFHLSPKTLRRIRCSCANPHAQLPDARAAVEYQLKRLSKVWRRTTAIPLPPEVHDASERVCLHLRETGGWEVAHLAGKVLQVPGGFTRCEISVLWLVPAPDEEIGHRVVAEVLTQLYGTGVRAGNVENVAVRFATEWTDWTVSQPHEYFRGTDAGKIHIPLSGKSKGDEVLETIYADVSRLLPGCQVSLPELIGRIGRATEELNKDGQTVCEFEVERVYRKSTSERTMNPAVRVAMHVSSGDVGAIVLIDTSGGERERKVKNIAVAYQGDWPIAHHYRTIIPPPDIDGLRSFVKE